MNTLTSCAAGLVLALGITGLTMGGAQAAPMVVTKLDDFNTAVGSAPVTLDTFDNPIAGAIEITFDSGVVSTAADGDLSSPENANSVRADGLSGFGRLVSDGRFAPVTLTWTFPVPVIAFLADFSFLDVLDVSIPGSGIFFDVATEIGADNGTFGLVDNQTAFTQIQFSVQEPTLSDLYRFDNLRFAAAPTVTAVPEPGTLAIFGLGLAGLALARRQGKRGTDVRKSARL